MKLAIMNRFGMGVVILNTQDNSLKKTKHSFPQDGIGGGMMKDGILHWCSNRGINTEDGIKHKARFGSPHSLIEHGGDFVVSNTTENNVMNHKGEEIYYPTFLERDCTKDYIHLNDCISVDGRLMLSSLSKRTYWRDNFTDGGLWYGDDVNNGATVYIPHTPCEYEGRIYVLETGSGSLLSFNKNLGDKKIELINFKGFLRGLIMKDGHAYIASSAFDPNRSFAKIHNCHRLKSSYGRIYKVNMSNGHREIIYESEGADISSICEA